MLVQKFEGAKAPSTLTVLLKSVPIAPGGGCRDGSTTVCSRYDDFWLCAKLVDSVFDNLGP